jgi:anti-sigma B factor antagonist
MATDRIRGGAMNVEKRVVENVHVLTPTKSLVGGRESDDLLSAAEEILPQEAPRIVIDLKKIDYVSSGGLGALIKVHSSCIKRGGWLRIIGVGTRIKNIFIVTLLIRVFDTYDTLEEAIAAPIKAGA